MGTLSLVALDTDHIKQYVFPTDKLKEIRGASSILDRLNRNEMQNIAFQVGGQQRQIYANGGSGLFVIDTENANVFCQKVQARYRKLTKGAASITCATQELPQGFTEIDDRLLHENLENELTLLRYCLQMNKNCAQKFVALPSHPFMRTCDACGMRYAEGRDTTSIQDPTEQEARYCASCLEKRYEDQRIKSFIDQRIKSFIKTYRPNSPLWDKLITILNNDQYTIPEKTERPNDFNDFRLFAGGKDYLGLIYADGNNMGTKTEDFTTLCEWESFAKEVDDAVYQAVGDAIRKHLPVWNPTGQNPLFPFDILLLGGDDVLMVTPADVALDVASTIAKQFHKHTSKKHTLSVGVVLAPVAYPFGMSRRLVESTLSYAKTEGAKRPVPKDDTPEVRKPEYKDTFINFMTVTGSSSQDFNQVYAALCEKHGKVNGKSETVEFYATLRPYTVKELDFMLNMIREGHTKALGHTKLHQVREAVLKLNLTSSVTEGLGVLRNWKQAQQDFVLKQVYTLGKRYQEQYKDPDRPDTLFPRVTFPWFADGPTTYRTSLLDFVELYNFVAQDSGENTSAMQAKEMSDGQN